MNGRKGGGRGKSDKEMRKKDERKNGKWEVNRMLKEGRMKEEEEKRREQERGQN